MKLFGDLTPKEQVESEFKDCGEVIKVTIQDYDTEIKVEDIISKDVGNRVEAGSDGGIYYLPVLLSSPLEAYKEARDSGV